MRETAIARRDVAGEEIFESVIGRGMIEAGSGTRAIGFETYFAVIYTSGTVQSRFHHPLRIGLYVEG
jgi:hypothetical protein